MNSSSLEDVYADSRLIRHDWSRIDDGKQMLCLLTALANDPDVRPETCSADYAQPWLAHLLPWIDDAGTRAAWDGHIRRLIPLAPHLHKLGRHADLRCRRVTVLESMSISPEPVIDIVLGLLDRAISGDEPTKEEWVKAAEAWAADAAAWAATKVAAEVAAAWAAGVAASRAALAAASMRSWLAAARAAREAEAAGAACADRMISNMISIFEDELGMIK